MRELTFVGPGSLEWRERPAPRIAGAGEALVRPEVVARCDLDRAIALGHFPAPGPFALGHETIGEVIEVGEGVRTVAPGDRVVVPFQISCGACDRCRRGQTGSCREVPRLASYGLGGLAGRDFGGGLSDVLHVPFADAMLVRLPAGVDPVIAAAAGDNAVDGWRTVAEPLAQAPGAPVLIVAGGAPSVGLYAVAAAKALGASEVVYVDRQPERVAVAEALGARAIGEAPRSDMRLGRFPITVDASAAPEGLRLALASTDVEGTCTSVGIYLAEQPMPLFELYTRGIRFVTGRANVRADLPRVLAALADRTLRIEAVVTTRVRWDEAAAAWTEPAAKMVVTR